MRRLWLLVLPVICLMLADVILAQNIQFKPVFPVTGRLDIFNHAAAPQQYQTFDTRTGAVLFQRDLTGTRPMLDRSQQWLAYVGGPRSISLLNLNYGTFFKHNFDMMGDADYLYPAGWGEAADGKNLLYLGFDAQSIYHVYCYELAGKLLSPALKTRAMNAPVTDAELPGVPPDAVLNDLYIMRNPVYSAWVAERSTLVRPLHPDADTVERFVIYDFWNYETGQYLFLNALLPQIQADNRRYGWSPDGTLFYYPATNQAPYEQIGHILRFDPETRTVTPVKSARTDWQFVSFLGVDDMLLTIRTRGANEIPEEAGTTIYSVSQLIDSEWQHRALFKITGDSGPDDMNFTLTGDAAERHKLSCLFNASCADN